MMGWRSVGMMAFFVTSLTAATLLAEPTGVPTDRAWLRQPMQRATSSPASTQLSFGKWVSIVLLVGLSGFALWKRKKGRRSTSIVVASQVQISGVTKISPKALLVVATVNGRSVLLGVTEANVNRLMWLDEAQSEDDDDVYPDRIGSRQVANSTPNRPSPAATQASQPKRQSSRFREIFADAIGLAPRVGSIDVSSKAPVDELARVTEDRYVGRDTRRTNAQRAGQKATPMGPLIDVEGQAAGLVMRLNRPPS